DPHLVKLWALLFFRPFQEVNGFATDDTGHRPFLGMDPNALTQRDHAVVAADPAKPDKPLVAHVHYDKADLVHVAREHDFHLGPGVQYRPDAAVHVGLHRVGEP